MFSGIVEDVGIIASRLPEVRMPERVAENCVFTIASKVCLEGTKAGDSVAVNGVCLTVIDFCLSTFTVEAIPETLRRTNLSLLSVGDSVNLERALTPMSRIGGHYVQGHVDGVATITHMEKEGTSWKVWCDRPSFLENFLIPKGYITWDGMSLTLVDVEADRFSVCLIPHTWEVTIGKTYRVGNKVNIEIDHVTKTIVSTTLAFIKEGLHGHN